MIEPNWTEVWTAYGTVATAVFTLFLFGAAVIALRGWKKA
jgi:hypothetical protein